MMHYIRHTTYTNRVTSSTHYKANTNTIHDILHNTYYTLPSTAHDMDILSMTRMQALPFSQDATKLPHNKNQNQINTRISRRTLAGSFMSKS